MSKLQQTGIQSFEKLRSENYLYADKTKQILRLIERGRPLLYCGTPLSCIAKLISEYELGFVVEMNNIKAMADILEECSHNKPKIRHMQEQAFLFYKTHFSKKLQWAKWDNSLREYVKA